MKVYLLILYNFHLMFPQNPKTPKPQNPDLNSRIFILK